MKRIDLHTHSIYSDGTFSPEELIKLAKEKSIAALALTDHDSIDGLHEAAAASLKYNVELIEGIEVSALAYGTEIHILGYFFAGGTGDLHSQLTELKKIRYNRNLEMIEKLNENGVSVTYDELLARSGGKLITRIHFAKLLVEKKYTSTINDSFKKYLSPGCKAYVPKKTPIAAKSIELIKNANGIAVLAHPLRYGLDFQDVSIMVRGLTELGIDGIEAIYSSHNTQEEITLKKLADKYGLAVTGGSDFHGSIKPHISLGDGSSKTIIPYSVLESLKKL